MKTALSTLAIIALAFASAASATPLVYQETNPAVAQAIANNNNYKSIPPKFDASASQPDLSEMMSASIANQLSSTIFSDIYGPNSIPTGTASLGLGSNIDWSTANGLTSVTINQNGVITQLQLPATR